MEWIDIKDQRPSEDCMCYVANVKAGMACFVCLYRKSSETFTLFDLGHYNSPAVEVTHYIILPVSPYCDLVKQRGYS